MRTRPTATPAVELRHADCGYRGRPVLHDVSVTIARGEFLGAVGPSGSGKTTFIRALTGQCQVLGGQVRTFGAPVRAGVPPLHIGYVPQIETVDTSFPITVERLVLQGLGDRGTGLPWPRRRDRARAGDLLTQLGLVGLADRPLADLSGGELQRAFLARALIREPDLLLLDEPTASVDLKSRHDVLHLLGELHGRGMTIVLTTHDLNFVAAHLPRLVCLAGKVVADGSPLEVLTPPVLRATYGAEVRVIHADGMVFVADPTHILTPRHHHDRRDHPVDLPGVAPGATPPAARGGDRPWGG